LKLKECSARGCGNKVEDTWFNAHFPFGLCASCFEAELDARRRNLRRTGDNG
jgi:hypothetical protein